MVEKVFGGTGSVSDGIDRRDFLQGAAAVIGLAAAGRGLASAANAASALDASYYPPALTGLRGSHPGSFEVAHQLRDQGGWQGDAGSDTGESYDLVVVGAGISGLAAAYAYRKERPDAKVLVLDNHDDFGGHAKRNEFTVDGRRLIGYGGTQSLVTSYPPDAIALLSQIGIDMRRFRQYFDQTRDQRWGLQPGIYFNRESFGVDRTLRGLTEFPDDTFLDHAPIDAQAKRDLYRIFSEKRDYLPHLNLDEKLRFLSHISFEKFLSEHVKVHPDVLKFFQSYPSELTGLGSDATSALVCIASSGRFPTYPLFLDPARNLAEGMALGLVPGDSYGYICHFPDGNASVARSLVRALIPAAVPGSTMEDLVTSRLRYDLLDEAKSPVRIRLNSTAVRLRHEGDLKTAQSVEVTFVRAGKVLRVKARNAVLACYNMLIPRLCDELSAPQREALLYPVKVPLVYTNVLISNARSLTKLGLNQIYCPNSLFYSICLDFPVSMGDYRAPATPDEPCLLHLSCHIPTERALPPREQRRLARMFLYTTPFEVFEQRLRDQLSRALGPGGFDAGRDIKAITLNRWPHGYADALMGLDDPEWPAGRRPNEIGRQRFGRVTIANTDSGIGGTGGAIHEGLRAVRELTA